jgi:hypothetical protein
MEMSEEEIKYQRAKARVAALRKFYMHLGIYVLVNLSLFLRNILMSPDNLWFYWPLLGWGIAIAIHAFSVFGIGGLLDADWEKRKIQEILKE